MARDRQRATDAQNSFSGGINTVSDDLSVLPNQFRQGVNTRLTEYGAVTKRNGTLKLSLNTVPGNPSSPIRGGFSWFEDSGSVETLVVSGGSLWTGDPSGAPMSWTENTVSGGISLTHYNIFEKFIDAGGNDVVYFTDGGKLLRWNGTTVNRQTNVAAPQLTYVKVHNNRLWGCGNPSFPDSIWYSTIQNGDTLGFGGGGQIIVRTFGDERIVALASINSSLMIFHRRGLSRLTGFGQDDISVDPEGISSQTGTIAPRSVVEIDNAVMFVSDRGVFIANESSVRAVSTGDQPDPLLPLLRQMTESQLENVVGVLCRDRQEVWFFIPGFGTYVYNLILQAWTGPWDGTFESITAMWQSQYDGAGSLGVMVGAANTVYYTDKAGIYGDGEDGTNPASGTDVAMRVKLRRLFFGNDAVAKSFRFGYLAVTLNGLNPLTASFRSDAGSWQSHAISPNVTGVWGTGTWNGGQRWGNAQVLVSARVELDGYGYYLDVTLDHSDRSIPIVSRWQVEGFILGRR